MVILTDINNKIYAYEAYNFYDGNMSDIMYFTNFLKKENEIFEFKLNKLLGDLTAYQWISDKKIIQFIKDNTEGTKERIINGKSSIIKSTYVKINAYNQSFIKKYGKYSKTLLRIRNKNR